jgi:hypothetical protein
MKLGWIVFFLIAHILELIVVVRFHHSILHDAIVYGNEKIVGSIVNLSVRVFQKLDSIYKHSASQSLILSKRFNGYKILNTLNCL